MVQDVVRRGSAWHEHEQHRSEAADRRHAVARVVPRAGELEGELLPDAAVLTQQHERETGEEGHVQLDEAARQHTRVLVSRAVCVASVGPADAPMFWQRLCTHGCLRVPGPPNLGLSRQLMHSPQSSRVQLAHWRHATSRTFFSSAAAAAEEPPPPDGELD